MTGGGTDGESHNTRQSGTSIVSTQQDTAISETAAAVWVKKIQRTHRYVFSFHCQNRGAKRCGSNQQIPDRSMNGQPDV